MATVGTNPNRLDGSSLVATPIPDPCTLSASCSTSDPTQPNGASSVATSQPVSSSSSSAQSVSDHIDLVTQVNHVLQSQAEPGHIANPYSVSAFVGASRTVLSAGFSSSPTNVLLWNRREVANPHFASILDSLLPSTAQIFVALLKQGWI